MSATVHSVFVGCYQNYFVANKTRDGVGFQECAEGLKKDINTANLTVSKATKSLPFIKEEKGVKA